MTAAPEAAVPAWHIRGHVILACNCDYGCPCNFNGLPTTGKCEGNWNWHITDGRYGDVPLSGLTFSVAVNWPKAIHNGNGEGLVLIDERANGAQRDALQALVGGKAGGPWKIISTTISKVSGPHYVPIEVKFDGFHSSVSAGDFIELQLEPVKNPVTGAEIHPHAVLPEGMVFKDGMLAASTTFRIAGPVSFEHPGRYAAAAEFEYQGP